MKILANPWFNAQFERTIGHSTAGGADLGECFSLKEALAGDDFDAWYLAWYELAGKLERQAEKHAANGEDFSAYSAYLRASNYFRSSFFFLDEQPTDPRIEQAYELARTCFQKALQHSEFVFEPLRIPFAGTHLPAYLFLPEEKKRPWPLLIDTGGGDAIKEELFFTSVTAALQRGYACLVFDGPGQGEMLRKYKMPFQPDWEAVITAVIDHVSASAKVLVDKFILYGSSFGGYLAPRAATVEQRIAACIANPGILNASGNQADRLPADVRQALDEGNDEKVNRFFEQLKQKDKMMGFLFESRKVRFAAKTMAEMLRKTRDYHIEESVRQIQCPLLVLDNELEHITQGQAEKLYAALSSKGKHYHLFREKDGHGGHCQPLSHCYTNEVIFSWLNRALA